MEQNISTKRTLVMGASENPDRYSNKAIHRLQVHHIPVVAVGKHTGVVNGVAIHTDIPQTEQIDTVTLYLNPPNQAAWIQQLIDLKPRRIIFNPGTENPAFAQLAEQAGIETENACTLVLLATGGF
ncbi:MAG: CoA-binding protein [Bacteroidia bacterium]|nr:CoA-binding protein [Bacteroidia bacterium]